MKKNNNLTVIVGVILSLAIIIVASMLFFGFSSMLAKGEEGDTVKTLTDVNAFTDIPNSTIFFVKDELVATYKDATNWSTYAEQIMPMSEEGNYYG